MVDGDGLIDGHAGARATPLFEDHCRWAGIAIRKPHDEDGTALVAQDGRSARGRLGGREVEPVIAADEQDA